MRSGTPMATNYKDSKHSDPREMGEKYQDIITDILAANGMILQNYCSRQYQYQVGENRQGWEIKYDALCTSTRRLSIEVGEKTNSSKPEFTPSGICREDNSWLYIQGNLDVVYIFQKNILRMLMNSGRYEIIDNNPDTIRKFYLPFEVCEKYAGKILKVSKDYEIKDWMR